MRKTISRPQACLRAGVTTVAVAKWMKRWPSIVADGASRPALLYLDRIDDIIRTREAYRSNEVGT